MGNWVIVIEGTGSHHNNNPSSDVDLMVHNIVDSLKKAGQNIEHATITYGGRQHSLVSGQPQVVDTPSTPQTY